MGKIIVVNKDLIEQSEDHNKEYDTNYKEEDVKKDLLYIEGKKLLPSIVEPEEVEHLNEDDSYKEEEAESRLNLLAAFIGHNRTGKTSVAIEFTKDWIVNNPDGEVAGFDPQNKFGDLLDIKITPKKGWEDIILGLRNCLVILDDYRALHHSARCSEGLLEILMMRSEYNLDIIYITHNPRLVLETLTYYTSHYFIFYTQGKKSDFESRIPNYELCNNAAVFMKDYVFKNGRGKWPNFPHIVVDSENERLIAQNIIY